MNYLRVVKANIGVTKVGQVQSLKMTTLSPVATLENVKNLLALVLEEADRILKMQLLMVPIRLQID